MKQDAWPTLSKKQIEMLRLKYFNMANDAAYVFDFEDGRILDANNYIIDMLGYSYEELLHMTVFDIHPEQERGAMLELIELFNREGQVRGLSTMHLQRKDGTHIPVEKNGTLFTLDGRKVIQCTCRDITQRKRIEAELNRRIEDMHVLNSIALEITSGLELEALLPRITQSVVKLLGADAGAIGIFEPRRDVLVYRYLYNLPESLARVEIPRGAGLTSYVSETKQTVTIPDYSQYEKAIGEFVEAGVRAIAIVPLLFENNLLGTIIVVHKAPEKRFSQYDIGLLESVAHQAAIAVYNAQLFTDMRDESEFRQALNQLTSAIGSTLDINKVYNLMCEEGTKLFRNSGTYLYTVDTANGLLIGKAAYGEKARDFLKITLPISEPSLVAYIYHTRKPMLIDDVETHPMIEQNIRRKFASKTLMGVPIVVDGEVKSVLVLASSERAYFFNEVQLERAKILSSQVAFAIKNADLYEKTRRALEHERYVAVTLQQGLLPDDIPNIPGIEVGAYYAPTSVGEALVGGDFYDFIQIPDGRVAVIIGDVSGKGIEAAAITAMVKYALRSFVYKDPSPSHVLTQANNVVSMQLKLGAFVSLCYVLLDPKTGDFDFASAGHPHPVRYRAADDTYAAIEMSSPVFTLLPDHAYGQIREKLAEEDILVLYTDGLIEARADQRFFGIDGVKEALQRHHALPAQHIALNLVHDAELFARGSLSDDVAILVLKRAKPA